MTVPGKLESAGLAVMAEAQEVEHNPMVKPLA
jgi:hypothetical protein